MTQEEQILFLEDRIIQLQKEIDLLKSKGNKHADTFDTVLYAPPQKGLYAMYNPEGYSVQEQSGGTLTFETLQNAVNRAMRDIL